MTKKFILLLLKVSLTLGLVYWTVSNGKIDLSLVKEIQYHWPTFLGGSLILLSATYLLGYRLRLLLQARSQSQGNLNTLFMINWIGTFFNAVIPGTVSGDLIKIFYLQKEFSDLSKRFLFMGVFVDRVIGLMGLICIGGIASLFLITSPVALNGAMKQLILINELFFLGVIFSFLLLFLTPKLPIIVANKIMSVTQMSLIIKVLEKLSEFWNSIVLFKTKLLICLLVSGVLQSMAVITFWIIANLFTIESIPLYTFFTIIPMGFIALAVPIAPSGLGVGHMIFETLFNFFQIPSGANLFNMYFILVLMTNLTGLIPYVIFKQKKIAPELQKI